MLHVDPRRIAILGESSGGGIAAGVALMARDRGLEPPLRKQILIYPMLDDRNTTQNPEMEPFLLWTNSDNITGWTALLGEDMIGTDQVSEYAAPARAKDLKGMPETYIDVGGLDKFLEEDVEYARRLISAGVVVELHVHSGAPHFFEGIAPQSGLAGRAMADRLRALKKI